MVQKDSGSSVLSWAPETVRSEWTCKICGPHFPDRIPLREVARPRRWERGEHRVEADRAGFGLAGRFAGTPDQHRSGEMPGPRPAKEHLPCLTPMPWEVLQKEAIRGKGCGPHAAGLRSRTAWWNGDCTRSPGAFRKTETFVSFSLESGVFGFYPLQWRPPGTPRTALQHIWERCGPFRWENWAEEMRGTLRGP